jgi:hypothetical protein
MLKFINLNGTSSNERHPDQSSTSSSWLVNIGDVMTTSNTSEPKITDEQKEAQRLSRLDLEIRSSRNWTLVFLAISGVFVFIVMIAITGRIIDPSAGTLLSRIFTFLVGPIATIFFACLSAYYSMIHREEVAKRYYSSK